jgi:transposase
MDDYVDADHPVRFLDAFVDGLDLEAAGFARVQAATTGRPGYHPADLLKLYLYGYLNRIRSSRRLELETRRNLEVIWLLRGLRPDFKTIADFRKDNRHAFKAVFQQFIVLCGKLGLLGKALVAVDGTWLKAVNNVERNFTREKLVKLLRLVDADLEDYLARLDRCDLAEGEDVAAAARAKRLAARIEGLSKRQGFYRELLDELQRSGNTQISLTDPDARATAIDPKVGVGYNAQVAVDSKHKLIVAQQVTNAGSDLGLLGPTALAAKEALGVESIQAVADKGYYQSEDLKACEQAGVETYVARPQRGAAVHAGRFRKEEFVYDAQSDTYRCPAHQILRPEYRYLKEGRVIYCNRAACRGCALKARCTGGLYRQIRRWEHEAVLDRMEGRLNARPDILSLRRHLVEHPFGSIKQWMNQGAFLTRGLEKVRAEFSLTALAYNLTRVLNVLGVATLLHALKTV